MTMKSFAGSKALVMGLGRFGGGVDAVRFLHGAGAQVMVTDVASAAQLGESLGQLADLSPIEFHLGGHLEEDFERADVVVVNPAVPLSNKFVRLARELGKVVTSQMNIFFDLCSAAIVGITGANGKSTTTALTAHLLRARADRDVWLGGNIGNEPLLMVVDRIKPDDVVALEISSFQIEQLAQEGKAPDIALLTNLTPNHLDRYGSFEAYCAAKEQMFRLQRPRDKRVCVSIFNAEDRVGCEWFNKYSIDGDRKCIKFSADDVSEEIRSHWRLPGRGNLSNLAAALSVARHFGVGDECVKGCLSKFKALPHRLELVADIGGVRWYNDSKATTPEGAMTALEAFDCPKIIIAGGYDKQIEFNELGKNIATNAKAAILVGQTAQKIADAITACVKKQTQIEIVDSLANAVSRASQLAASGDVVMLSPACASYDMFENYQQRGQEFVKLVRAIVK